MRTFLALVLAAEVFGLASPLLVGLVGIPDPDVGMTFAQAWFFALPTLVDGWLLPDRANMLAVAAGVYVVQYLAVFGIFWVSSHLVQRHFESRGLGSRLNSGKGKDFEAAVSMYYDRDRW